MLTGLPSHVGLDSLWSPSPLVSGHGSGLPPLPPSLWTFNITTYVTVVLALLDEYMSWETQLTSFFIMQQLHGMLDSTIVQPVFIVFVALDVQQPNPAY